MCRRKMKRIRRRRIRTAGGGSSISDNCEVNDKIKVITNIMYNIMYVAIF